MGVSTRRQKISLTTLGARLDGGTIMRRTTRPDGLIRETHLTALRPLTRPAARGGFIPAAWLLLGYRAAHSDAPDLFPLFSVQLARRRRRRFLAKLEAWLK